MPDWKQVVRRRLADVKLEGAREAEVVDELAQHLEDRYQALRSTGLADPEAQRQASEELNGNELLAEELRKASRPSTNASIGSSNRGGLLTGLLYDLKIALRNASRVEIPGQSCYSGRHFVYSRVHRRASECEPTPIIGAPV